MIQEVGMVRKAVELEVNLVRCRKWQPEAGKGDHAFRPQAAIRNVRITANTKIDRQVEKVVSDTDLKVAQYHT